MWCCLYIICMLMSLSFNPPPPLSIFGPIFHIAQIPLTAEKLLRFTNKTRDGIWTPSVHNQRADWSVRAPSPFVFLFTRRQCCGKRAQKTKLLRDISREGKWWNIINAAISVYPLNNGCCRGWRFWFLSLQVASSRCLSCDLVYPLAHLYPHHIAFAAYRDINLSWAPSSSSSCTYRTSHHTPQLSVLSKWHMWLMMSASLNYSVPL